MPDARYFPSLTIRQSEAEALTRLAEPVKDAIFPIFRLQAWPNPKKGLGGPVSRSMDHATSAFGTRRFGLDLALPLDQSAKEYRTAARAAWAQLGRDEVAALHVPGSGFDAWCRFVEADDRVIPVVQWTDDLNNFQSQVSRLSALGRGLIFRFRRTANWNLGHAALLATMPLGDTPILMIYDYEQLQRGDDLTAVGVSAQGAILALNRLITGGARDHVFKGSSFPSEFVSSGEEYACLPIRERQLFEMLRASPAILAAGIRLSYGDHASVYVSPREPAFRGVPRVDYPVAGNWIYHRRREGFQDAAVKVRTDSRWDDANLCWGAQRIREAAAGKMDGLNSPGRWTTVRLNIHMHVQAQSAGAPLGTDEPWID